MKKQIKFADFDTEGLNEYVYEKDGKIVVDNTTSGKITFKMKKTVTVDDKELSDLHVKFTGEVENSGGYLMVNGYPVSINSESVMPLTPPISLNISLTVSAKSRIVVSEIAIELDAEADLLGKVNRDCRVLVITPQYPSYANLYLCAFAHSRNKEYVKNGLDIQVFVPTSWYQTAYERSGIPVFSGTYADLKRLLSEKHYDVIVVHFVDVNLYPIFDADVYDNQKLIFICHSPETLYRYLTRTCGPYFTLPVKEQYFDPAFDKADAYVRKYASKDNVEWVFVSDWLKEKAETDQGLKFRHARVINNIIDEDLFPYSPKNPEDRKKILMVRKFDNTREHGIDLVVLAILALSRKDFFNDLDFDIYGDGNYYDELTEPLKQFKNVHLYRKFLPNEELYSLYRSHGIMMLASRTDAHAVSMGESAASGLVVLGTKVTSNPYFMNEAENHTLADPEHFEQLADIIERLYLDPDEFLRVSRNMAEYTRNFNKEHTVAKEIALIKESLDKAAELKPFEVCGEIAKDPVLTIGVPAYNVEKYIGKCLTSILSSRCANKIEVLVINDGSSDKTADIVKEFEAASRGVVRLINKENGGHGSGINRAIAEARGKYLRFVDGDDWVDSENLAKLVDIMENSDCDAILTKGSYAYAEKAQYEDIISYDNLKEGIAYCFDDLVYDHYGFSTYGPILSTGNYKTEVLRRADFKITEKKPYVDMEFNSFSIKYVNSIAYYDLDIYRYLIGREGQTVSREYWKKKYRDHVYIIFNILDKVSSDSEYTAQKKMYVYKNVIASMVDSQVFMYDAVGAYDELDGFLTKLRGYDEAFSFSMKFIAKRRGNCYLILKLYKYFMKNPGKGPIIVVGERETIDDLKKYHRLLSKLESDKSLGLPIVKDNGASAENASKDTVEEVEFRAGLTGKLMRGLRYIVPYGLVVSRRLRQENKK
ncbi:MAG: glycosyltransferase [Clostridia bacterium]|nr:glycosyltransferase [Clostridia bacterium]